MAKIWAKPFYNSKAWRALRHEYVQDVCGLCERCGEVGNILHHKIKLTPQNINDPRVSLNKDYLEYLCIDCHNADKLGEHKENKRRYAYDAQGNILPPIINKNG